MSAALAAALVALALVGLAASVERAVELSGVRRALTHAQRRLARAHRTLDATRAGLAESDHARDVALVERDAARRSEREARGLVRVLSDELNRLRARLNERAAKVPKSLPTYSEHDGRLVIARELVLRGAVAVQVPVGPVPTWHQRHLPFETTWGAA